MLQLYADNAQLTVRQRELLTSGSKNAFTVRIHFSKEWDGLDRTVLFRAGERARSVLLDGTGTCVIPREVLRRPEVRLFCGVCGTLDGQTVLPTIWADLGVIREGVSFREDAFFPDPELLQQMLDQKGEHLALDEDGVLGLYSGEQLLSSVQLAQYEFGHGLRVEGNTVTVNTANDFDGDNTLPITAAAVQGSIGNIEVLLGTI